MLSEDQHRVVAATRSDAASARLTNIKVVSGEGQTTQGDLVSSIEKGGAAVNSQSDSGVAASHLLNQTTASSAAALDEQGIRAFLLKLLNAQHIFDTNDIVDQIEAFIQIKMDKCNQMIAAFRDRLAKAEKETKRALLENKKLSTD